MKMKKMKKMERRQEMTCPSEPRSPHQIECEFVPLLPFPTVPLHAETMVWLLMLDVEARTRVKEIAAVASRDSEYVAWEREKMLDESPR